MTLFTQQLVNGIALGSEYSLVALGLTLVFGVLKIPNFAHGALYMAGAYVTYVLLTTVGVPYLVALALAAAALALVGRRRLAGDFGLGLVLWGVPIALIGVGPGRDQTIWTDSGRASALFETAAV